jgi:Family of unknown function (DUF6636)
VNGRRHAVIALAACCAAALASSAGAARRGDEVIGFSTPSKNIGCVYAHFSASAGSPATTDLRCDIRSGLRPKPAKPPRCDLDYGDSYAMGKRGRAYVVCHGDTALGSKTILGYGRTWSRDGFTCVSRTNGLTCKNLSGHGFFLSRQRSYRF